MQGTDVGLTKTVSNPAPFEGSAITYTVTASNIGIFAATNIDIEDVLPAGLTFVSATPSTGAYSGGLWYLPALAPGVSASLQIVATAQNSTAGTTITNSAQVVNLDQVDRDLTNNSASIPIIPKAIPVLPNLTFLKSSAVERDPINDTNFPKAIPGAEVLYTLQVSNFGAGAVTANSLSFVDPIPVGTSLFVGDLGQGSPVLFADADADSGFAPPQPFTLSYSSKADCATYNYVPGGSGFDANVCRLHIQMNGTFSGAAGIVIPDFSLSFRIRVD